MPEKINPNELIHAGEISLKRFMDFLAKMSEHNLDILKSKIVFVIHSDNDSCLNVTFDKFTFEIGNNANEFLVKLAREK